MTTRTGPRRLTPRTRLTLFGAVVAVTVIAGALYVVNARQRNDRLAATAPAAQDADATTIAAVAELPHLVFRSTAYGTSYGKLSLLSTEEPGATRVTSTYDCDRVAANADRVLCLAADRGAVTTYSVTVLDAHLRELGELAVEGIPSRAAVSPDGRFGATTTFVSGDSYAAASFSTRTVVYDLTTTEPLGNLEEFDVTRDGSRFKEVDFNFWGVTFRNDGGDFYATLGTGGHQYLVEGSVATREITVLRDGVECPSLSPDGTRIAFKKRSTEGGAVHWQLSVLDLATMTEHPLAETRNVDDQVAWLDDDTVLYGLPRASQGTAITDTWAVPADGTGTPQLYLAQTWSVVPTGPLVNP
jgi:hypothetical protein